MSKYVPLTTTKGIKKDDIIYMHSSNGPIPCAVLEVDPTNNTVRTIFKELLDSLKKPGAFAHPDVMREMLLNGGLTQPMPVSNYYKKHVPKPRPPKSKPEPSAEPDDKDVRTPDMYNFDF